ncbi:MAG: peptidase [Beggiatoa sp. IS2]|nr:MAG: peptidase [Beggiatoa sp. IS2]
MFKKILTTTFLILLFVSCGTSPFGRKQLIFMPASEMDAMGIKAFAEMKQETPIETNAKTNRYVQCVTHAILETFDTGGQEWEVVVFDDESINAFALPGGKVGVYTGLFQAANNQHRLAAVIGHEIAHVRSQHGNERVSQKFAVEGGLALGGILLETLGNVSMNSDKGQLLMAALGGLGQLGIILPYSRTHESEADELGLQYMAQAGFDPRESVALWQKMSQTNEKQSFEFLSTHPANETRIQQLNNAMGGAMQLYQQARASGKNPDCRQ